MSGWGRLRPRSLLAAEPVGAAAGRPASRSALRWLSSPSDAFHLALAMILLAIPSLIRVAPFQPMRFLHLVYFFMTLLGGCLLGQYLLRPASGAGRFILRPSTAECSSRNGCFSTTATTWSCPAGRTANPWLQAFDWVRENTPKDAYFALDPEYMAAPREDYHCFRALAERGMLADNIKDPAVVTQVPQLASRWAREARARKNWKSFQLADFNRLKTEFGVNWVLVNYPAPAGLDCRWHNDSLAVCLIL